jgi:hydrophobe/amphiphile efflux-3 (HAE3) family protein
MESDLSMYLPEDDPRLELWDRINTEFHVGQTIIIIVDQTERYHDVREYEVLQEMHKVAHMINPDKVDDGEFDGVVSVRSLAESIKEENNNFPTINSLAEGDNGYKIPSNENKNDDIGTYLNRDNVKSMKGVLFTDDFKLAVIIVQLSEKANFDEVLVRAERAVENEGNKDTDMTITGTVAMQKAIQEDSMNNLFWMFPIALVLVSIVIFFFHRSVKGIIIAFLPPAFALVLTFGVLGTIQPALSIISVAIVALLMGLGVDYSIHLMNRLIEEKTIDDKIERVNKTLKFTGKAVLLSTITTMIGFGSLMISSMSPMVTFGFGCAIGILFCFISAMILVPCLVLILKFEKKGTLPSWRMFAGFVIKYRGRIILVASFFVVLSLILIPKVETDVNYNDLAPEGIPEVEAMQIYSDEFGGGANFNALLVETNTNGLREHETITIIDKMQKEIRDETKKMGHPVTVGSYADVFAEISEKLGRFEILEQIFNYTLIEDPKFDLSEVDKALFDKIANEGLINEDCSMTVVVVSIPVGKSMQEIEKIVNKINTIASNTKIPDGRISELTGQDAINAAVNKKLTDEQIRSMIIALLFVLAALIIIFSSTTYGFLTIIPIAFVLAWEPGFLVAMDISLSVVTISIASIMIGIGIDYGIHITQRIREGLQEGLSKQDATKNAIEKTGISLVEAASTTIAGMISIYFVNIPSLQEFGIIVLLMTALSCIAAAFILPVFFCSKLVK